MEEVFLGNMALIDLIKKFRRNKQSDTETEEVIKTDARVIDWQVNCLYDEFRFQIGDNIYIGKADTGMSLGACIKSDDFEKLAEEGIISDVEPITVYNFAGKPYPDSLIGKGSISFYDTEGIQRTFNDISITTTRDAPNISTLLGNDFLNNFYQQRYYLQDSKYRFQGIMFQE